MKRDAIDAALRQAEVAARGALRACRSRRSDLTRQLKAYGERVDSLAFDTDAKGSDAVQSALQEFREQFESLRTSLHRVVSEPSDALRDSYAELERNAAYATIMLFGRTRAGKSTTMEALSG